MPSPASSLISLGLPATATQAETGHLQLGRYQPAEHRLTVNSRWLERDGQPWVPVMGEFHYSRFPQDEWDTELRKMAAGGVDIVASYVLWNHHEEEQGQFDWRGRRDLRRFVQQVREAGMLFYLRPGPWVHAEARLGGFPDWLPARGPVRCNDPGYLQCVRRLFGQIGEQLRGLMWRDGGPVIGVQLENEYDRTGPGCGAEHIAELKRLAIEAGLTVPLYTVTGWPTLDIPVREVVPVSGAYADGFWSGAQGPLPASGVFLFDTSRAIGEMGNVGGTPAAGHIDKSHYPFFLAEAGGGMHVSYHRRPVVSADDVAATALVQVGSGANLYGYYMYHGGANPPGRLGPLHETQASGYPNDVPVINYDFRTPLGQYGQVRPSYGRLRCLHQFMAAFGAELAPMEAVLRDEPPLSPADDQRLRVAVRGTGGQGFVFVNNHVRHHPMPNFEAVQLRLRTSGGIVVWPRQPVTVRSGTYFIWPFGLALGGARLHHATVQLLTRWTEGDSHTWVAFALPSIAPVLCFDAASISRVDLPDAPWTRRGDELELHPRLGDVPLIVRLTDAQGHTHTLVLLTRTLAEQSLKARVHGRDRLCISPHLSYVHDDALVVSVPNDALCSVRVFPADDLALAQTADGLATVHVDLPPAALEPVLIEPLHDNPQPPAVQMGPHIAWRQGAVPQAPADDCYDAATRIRLHLPDSIPHDQGRVLLAVDYVGDAARLYADDQFVDDHFYDGDTWWIGVDRFATQGRWPRLELAILAADPDAGIFLEPAARERLRDASALAPSPAAVLRVGLQWWRERRITLPAPAAGARE